MVVHLSKVGEKMTGIPEIDLGTLLKQPINQKSLNVEELPLFSDIFLTHLDQENKEMFDLKETLEEDTENLNISDEELEDKESDKWEEPLISLIPLQAETKLEESIKVTSDNSKIENKIEMTRIQQFIKNQPLFRDTDLAEIVSEPQEMLAETNTDPIFFSHQVANKEDLKELPLKSSKNELNLILNNNEATQPVSNENTEIILNTQFNQVEELRQNIQPSIEDSRLLEKVSENQFDQMDISSETNPIESDVEITEEPLPSTYYEKTDVDVEVMKENNDVFQMESFMTEIVKQDSVNRVATIEEDSQPLTSLELEVFEEQTLPKVLTKLSQEIHQPTLNEPTTIKLTLQPEKLGELEVVLEMKEGKVNAEFRVDSPRVKTLFESHLTELKENLVKQHNLLQPVDISVEMATKEVEPHLDFGGSFNHRQSQQQAFEQQKSRQRYDKTEDYVEEVTHEGVSKESVDILV